MPVLLGLWWLGATTSAPLVPVVLPGGEAVADWQRPLSLCESYRLTPSAAAPTTGPVVQIRSHLFKFISNSILNTKILNNLSYME